MFANQTPRLSSDGLGFGVVVNWGSAHDSQFQWMFERCEGAHPDVCPEASSGDTLGNDEESCSSTMECHNMLNYGKYPTNTGIGHMLSTSGLSPEANGGHDPAHGAETGRVR